MTQSHKHTPLHRVYTLLLLISALCTFTACAQSEDISPKKYPQPMVCQTDNECGPGLICNQGFCDAGDTNQRLLEFTFLPANDSKYLPQRTGVFAIRPSDTLAFELQSSLKVQGTITRSNAPGLLAGTLIFERSNEQYEKIYTRQARINQGEFAVDLVPGKYDLTFVPESSNLPSKTWPDQTFELNSDFSRALPDLRNITGTVSYRVLGDGDQDTPFYVEGARVIAVSQETGQLSTIGQTDASGFFELSLWPDTGKYDIVIAPTTPLDLVPQVIFEGTIDTSKSSNDAQNLSLNIGQLPQNTSNISLSFDKAQSDMLDFNPSDLRIILKSPTGKGQLQLSTRFGEVNQEKTDWSLALDVLPLIYDIELIPPASSRFARTVIRLDMRSPTQTYVLQMEEKQPVQAQLLYQDAQGNNRPLVGATVQWRPNDSRLSESGLFEQNTDSDGRVFVYVDKQAYAVHVIPPPKLGLPRAYYTYDGNAPQKEAIVWKMPRPTVLLGSVFDVQATGQPNMTVQVHEGKRADRRLIAEGRTGEDGIFALIISSVQ